MAWEECLTFASAAPADPLHLSAEPAFPARSDRSSSFEVIPPLAERPPSGPDEIPQQRRTPDQDPPAVDWMDVVAELRGFAREFQRNQATLGLLVERVDELEQTTAILQLVLAGRGETPACQLPTGVPPPAEDQGGARLAMAPADPREERCVTDQADRRVAEIWPFASFVPQRRPTTQRSESPAILLNLAGIPLGDEGAEALADALQVTKSIRYVYLGGTTLGNNGAKAMARALKGNQTLHTLGLESNGIGDEGAAALADVLGANPTLHTLNLQRNTIADGGAQALARALAATTSLRILYLGENDIGNHGFVAIADSLAANLSMDTILLSGNRIDAAVARQVVHLLRTHRRVNIACDALT